MREVYRVAVSCPIAVDILFISMFMECKQGSDCRDAQTMQCKPATTFVKVWKAGERLLQAQPHCANGTVCNGNVAERRWYERSCTYRNQGMGQQASECNAPSLTASMVQYAMGRWQCDKKYGSLVNVLTKPDWVHVDAGWEHSFD